MTKVTLRDYYSFIFHSRNDIPNHIFRMFKLTQQFFVDSYVKVESNNLNYIRTHQEAFRNMDYQRHDYLNNRAHYNGQPVGNMFILPSTFQVRY